MPKSLGALPVTIAMKKERERERADLQHRKGGEGSKAWRFAVKIRPDFSFR